MTRDAALPFSTLFARAATLQDATALARFEESERDVMAALARAWGAYCPRAECAKLAAFKSVASLRAHVYREHGESWCDLCVDHGRAYLRDLPRYSSRDALKAHVNDARTHPRCAFCARGFFDDEALFLHCTSAHESCFLCERLGVRHQYFKDYAHLWRHFTAKHHVCEDASCRALKFIAFASPQELQAHRLQQHRDSMSRDELLDARRLNIDVRLTTGAQLHLNDAAAAPSIRAPAQTPPSPSSSDAMSFADSAHKTQRELEVGDGATYRQHPLPATDAERDTCAPFHALIALALALTLALTLSADATRHSHAPSAAHSATSVRAATAR